MEDLIEHGSVWPMFDEFPPSFVNQLHKSSSLIACARSNSPINSELVLQLYNSMDPRPAKRLRSSINTSYHDTIPLLDDYELVQAREGRLRRVGNNLRTAPLARTTHHETPSWTTATSWAPVDDSEFALDPGDGSWYNEVVEADVMEEFSPEALKKRYIRSKVSVSSSHHAVSILR